MILYMYIYTYIYIYICYSSGLRVACDCCANISSCSGDLRIGCGAGPAPWYPSGGDGLTFRVEG